MRSGHRYRDIDSGAGIHTHAPNRTTLAIQDVAGDGGTPVGTAKSI